MPSLICVKLDLPFGCARQWLCTSRAEGAARQRGWELSGSKGLATTAMIGGPIVALGTFSYIYEAEEIAYEEAFKTCLKERSHEILE